MTRVAVLFPGKMYPPEAEEEVKGFANVVHTMDHASMKNIYIYSKV